MIQNDFVKKSTAFLLCATLALALFFRAQPSFGATIEELQRNIAEKNAQIESLNKEIEELNKNIQVTNAAGKTLQNAIKTLDTTGSKLNTEVKATESKISKTDLVIKETGLEINAKEQKIERNLETIASTLRDINAAEDASLLETILSNENLGFLWDSVETMQKFQTSVKDQIHELRGFKTELEIKKQQTEKLRAELQELKDELVDKKKVVDVNKKDKATLLAQTKNQEANYKKMLAEKQALSEAFEKEIFDIESQIKIAIDPKSVPKATKGILSWPIFPLKITQYFGLTAFAKSGAYAGKGHNGIDFGAPVGTAVKAVLSGVVEETGDTDLKKNCYSYGKWVFIRHNNGLASVYGHLSYIKAKAGDEVKTGDIIAYSGSTGYSTGPHLHLSLFASQGVKVMPLTNSVNCKNVRIPVADQKAYLDPLPYF